MMIKRVIIFGTGLFYERRKYLLPIDLNIAAFLDSNPELQGNTLDDIVIDLPQNVTKYEYDVIILASGAALEMRNQLLRLGISNEKIMFWEEFICEIKRGEIIKYGNIRQGKEGLRSFLAIVPIINFAGGFMTAFYMAQVMKKKGIHSVIVSPVINEKTVEYVIQQGIEVWQCPSLPYVSDVELKWINKFDYILCNSLQTIICGTGINCDNMLFWIHEHSKQYEGIIDQYFKYCNIDRLKDIRICAVSDIGKDIFDREILQPHSRLDILPFGIEDTGHIQNDNHDDKITIAIIGSIYPLKNQLFFVNTIKNLPEEYHEKCKCLIIGRDLSGSYRKIIDDEIKGCSYIQIVGELTQESVKEEFKNINVVVCTSEEETMSMTIVEGMMNSCLCVTNMSTGISKYIEDGINGYIYEKDNEKSLRNKLMYIIDNYDKLSGVKKKARETYDKQFSLAVFEKRILEIFGLV